MAFLVYKRLTAGDSIRYERLRPLKLAGAAGAVAQFVKTLPPATAAQGWSLPVETLIQLAGITEDSTQLAVLFDLSPAEVDAVCLYRLLEIHGVAKEQTTHLSLDFELLTDAAIKVPALLFKAAFQIPAAQPRKMLREILMLSGGPGGGTWKWETPAMNLGATVVRPSPPPQPAPRAAQAYAAA